MPQEKKPSLEETVQQLVASTQLFITFIDINLKNQAAAIHNLDVQAGQMATLLYARTQGSSPSNTKNNLKEQVHAITLRSNRVLEQNQVLKLKKKVIKTLVK